MAATDRDYYEVLGVARDCDEATIKKSFRRLARELHPDVSDHPEAELRFREITEAYEVLSSTERRALYDRYGHAGLRSGGFSPTQFDMGNLGDIFASFFGDGIFGSAMGGNAQQRGADLGAEIEIELVDASRGAKVSVPFDVAVTCKTCGGDGVEPGTEPLTCPRCEGTGRLHHVSRSVFGEFVRAQACPECQGRGVIIEHPCLDCDGAGRRIESRELSVDVPAGIHDGQRIRVSGEGHAGTLGGRSGDVYVLVHVKPDPRFVREGNDIYSQVDLTIVQAALGATMTVETIDGAVELELPAGVQPGEVRVLKSKGMPVLQGFGRGDHRVLVNVSVPRHVTDEQRRLLEDFEAASDENTYRANDESFFDKLKSAFR
ncbi:MAG TPA: molecular chaperone DnaJ [Gaiellaceae bacterium]|jgi:molecular chaperone DnaJ|nr:molecular chaperone DnaJ [Gaiellaceae bacterium]